MQKAWKAPVGRQTARPHGLVRSCAMFVGALVAATALLATPAIAVAAPETPTTEAATSVTGTSATLNGTLNPGSKAIAGYYFTYGVGSCEGANTSPEKEAEVQALKVSTPVTHLEAKTEYMFCLVATGNLEQETASGAPLAFMTPGSAPVVESSEVTSRTPYSVSLAAIINPENESTTCAVEYGPTSAFGTVVPCEQTTLEGSGGQFASVSIGEPSASSVLSPNTTYSYRFVAENNEGQVEEQEGTFSTLPLEAPIFEGENASNITTDSAQLEGLINPNYQPTTYEFEYATNESMTGATKVPGSGTLSAEFVGQAVSTKILDLRPLTTYYYRIVASNPAGSMTGEPVQSFTTLSLPVVTTGEAQGISRTTAEMSGTVNPGGLLTIAHVAYISQAGYEAAGGVSSPDPYNENGGHDSYSVGVAGTDFAPHSIGVVQLRELQPGTTYHYAVVASNAAGTTIGPDMTFTTAAPTPPAVVTGEAINVSQTAVTLTGAVDTRGLQTTMSFEYGASPSLGITEPATVVPGSESGTSVAITLSTGPHLLPGTTFYYRAVAANADGVVPGALKTFTTATFPTQPAFTVPALPVLPQKTLPPETKPPKPNPSKPRSGSAKKLAKALKACGKKPKSKRAACRRAARRKYGKK